MPKIANSHNADFPRSESWKLILEQENPKSVILEKADLPKSVSSKRRISFKEKFSRERISKRVILGKEMLKGPILKLKK
uniref:Uncharacterized protein n=1 Tax=Romanomermis culicivorax TaxID=13658 RepID=A0A915JC77_ROMCU